MYRDREREGKGYIYAYTYIERYIDIDTHHCLSHRGVSLAPEGATRPAPVNSTWNDFFL